MAKAIANVDSTTDTFDQWLTQTNEVLFAMSNNAVTVDATANGATVTGNGSVQGSLSITNISANTIRGGTVETAANVFVISAMHSNNTITANTFGVMTGLGGMNATYGVANLTITTAATVNGAVTVANLYLSDVSRLLVISNTDLGSNTTHAQTLFTINAVTTPTAKLTIQAKKGANTEISEVVLASNAASTGTNSGANVFLTVYGTVVSPATANIGELSATQTGNTITVSFTQAAVSSSLKILATLFTY
jgi:hypothetical protein